jgi:Spy/CpxP family protein refolding chaperone
MSVNFKSFLLGTASGLAISAAAVAGTYLYLKQARKRSANIKGYLDLIPDLTPEQRAKVQEIRKVFLPKVGALRNSMRSRRAELAELLFDETAERSKLDAAVEEIIGNQAELEREVIDHILQEREILVASQRRRFHDIIVGQFASGGVGVHDLHRKES